MSASPINKGVGGRAWPNTGTICANKKTYIFDVENILSQTLLIILLLGSNTISVKPKKNI